MKTVTIHEAKTHLSRLIQECVEGEEIIIAKRDRPMVRLVPVAGARAERVLGLHRGQIEICEGFDAPLEDFAEYE